MMIICTAFDSHDGWTRLTLGTSTLALAILAASIVAFPIAKSAWKRDMRGPREGIAQWLMRSAVVTALFAALPLALVLAIRWYGGFSFIEDFVRAGVYDSHAEAQQTFLGMLGLAWVAGMAMADKFGFLERQLRDEAQQMLDVASEENCDAH